MGAFLSILGCTKHGSIYGHFDLLYINREKVMGSWNTKVILRYWISFKQTALLYTSNTVAIQQHSLIYLLLMFKLLKGLLLLMKKCNEIHIATSIQKLSWFMMSNIFKGTLYKGGLISKSLSLWLKSSKKGAKSCLWALSL